jgi:hypothetical protein
MKIQKTYIIMGLIIAFAAFFELTAHADELDQTTILTFSQPIQIPGRDLPAGTYVFKLASSDSDRNLVEIFNSDQTHLYGTFQTTPTERREPSDDTAITFAEGNGGNPEALLKWFYPGSLTGHEFEYSTRQEKELAQDRQQTVVASRQPTAISEPTGMGN